MNNQGELIKRSYKFNDIRATEDNNRAGVEGHAAVFNSKTDIGGWFYEIIDRGAFEGCDFTDVPFLVNHDTKRIPLARSRRNNGSSTMKLGVDHIGLLIKADFDIENNSEARQVYSSIQRGDIDGMSFSFRVADEKWDNLDSDMPTRTILRISKVYEVSAVNWPAYSDTDIKARDKSALDNARQALENARSKELDNSELYIYKLKNHTLGGM